MVIVRFLLRFVLIPLGALAASLGVALLVALVSGGRLLAWLTADPHAGPDMIETMLYAGPALLMALASASYATMVPALLAVAIAEIVAIRSWLYYAAAGGLAGAVGWWTMSGVPTGEPLFNQPTLMAAAGIVGGLCYWLVAGWSAGFWKPVFAAQTPPAPPRPAA